MTTRSLPLVFAQKEVGLYEEKCDFCMSQLVIIKYREILKILEENSNVIILKIPIEKVKSEEERRKEEEGIKNCGGVQ